MLFAGTPIIKPANDNGQKKEVDKKEEGHFIKVLVKKWYVHEIHNYKDILVIFSNFLLNKLYFKC